jgi:Mn-dependent DtxR family transcriptional regulator
MRRTKEICRLAAAGLTGRAIARSLGVSNSTVGDAITRLKAAGLTWKMVEALSESELERRLYRELRRSSRSCSCGRRIASSTPQARPWHS